MLKEQGNAQTNPLEFYVLDPNFLQGIIEDPDFDADDPQQLLNRYYALSALNILVDNGEAVLVQEGYEVDYLRELIDDDIFELFGDVINWEELTRAMTITYKVWTPEHRVNPYQAIQTYHLMRDTFGNK